MAAKSYFSTFILQQEGLMEDIAALRREVFVGSVGFSWNGRRDSGKGVRRRREGKG
jgi:hypothetical protein